MDKVFGKAQPTVWKKSKINVLWVRAVASRTRHTVPTQRVTHDAAAYDGGGGDITRRQDDQGYQLCDSHALMDVVAAGADIYASEMLVCPKSDDESEAGSTGAAAGKVSIPGRLPRVRRPMR
jgi:hypothetical protein